MAKFKKRKRRFRKKSFKRRVKTFQKLLHASAEKKFVITGPANGTFSGKNYFDLTSAIAVGTARNNRIGNEIFVRYIKAIFTVESANVTSDGNYRLSIVIPYEAVSGTGDFPGLNNLWNTDKFQVLWDSRNRLAVGNLANEYGNTPID